MLNIVAKLSILDICKGPGYASTISILHSFHAALFSCYILFISQFSVLRCFHVGLFLCCTFFMLHFFNFGKYWKQTMYRKHNQKNDLKLSTVNLFHYYFDILLVRSWRWCDRFKRTRPNKIVPFIFVPKKIKLCKK